MKSKKSIGFILGAFLFLLVNNALIGKYITKEYSILKNGTLTLQIPDTWKEKTLLSKNDIPPKIIYYINDIKIYITFHWNLTQISNVTISEIALARLKKVGENLIKNAKEEKLSIKRMGNKKSFVLYFTLTDKNPKKGYKCLTHGSTTRGNFILMATVFTNSKEDPIITKALGIIENGEFNINRTVDSK